jgi:hypothetical protein
MDVRIFRALLYCAQNIAHLPHKYMQYSISVQIIILTPWFTPCPMNAVRTRNTQKYISNLHFQHSVISLQIQNSAKSDYGTYVVTIDVMLAINHITRYRELDVLAYIKTVYIQSDWPCNGTSKPIDILKYAPIPLYSKVEQGY